MPELPEVETTVRFLRPRVRGRRILDVQIKSARLFGTLREVAVARKQLVGQKIKDVKRFGKNIVFELGKECFLLVHLMLTGRLWLNPAVMQKHDRLVFFLSGNQKLVFNDVRGFGRCRILKTTKGLVGQEPLQLKLQAFQNLFAGKTGVIKNLLLDQKIVAGIGNIYASEILWYAGLRPNRPADSLSSSDIRKLFYAMRRVLKLAIQKGGTSIRDYQKPDGTKGRYADVRRVYGRGGERCKRDGATIKRIIIGGRSSYFCPAHQV